MSEEPTGAEKQSEKPAPKERRVQALGIFRDGTLLCTSLELWNESALVKWYDGRGGITVKRVTILIPETNEEMKA